MLFLLRFFQIFYNKLFPWVSIILLSILLMACKPQPKTEKCSQIVSKQTCQMIGQLLIVGFGGINQSPEGKILWSDPNGTVFKNNSNIAKDISDWHIGGVIIFRGSFRARITGKLLRDRNIQNGDQLTKLNHALQTYNKKTRVQQKLPASPLFIAIDQEGGLVNPLVFVRELPNYTPEALGNNQAINSADPQKLQEALAFSQNYAKKTGFFLSQYGFNLNFAPDVDVNVNPINPIIGGLGRSYSASPDIVTAQAGQTINGLHSQNIITALKHFPGHGSSTGDTHMGLVDVTNTYQKDKELLPYQHLIGQGYDDFIMSTHVINGQIDRTQCLPGDPNNPETWCPGTMSYKTLTELLRNQLHFKGVIVSDDMAMGAVANQYSLETALEKSLNAGVDMFIISNHDNDYTPTFVNTIAKLVRDGKVPQSRIEDAYQHVLAAKQRLL